METSTAAHQAKPRRKIPHSAIAAAGYIISIACLVWVYYGFDWKTELPRFYRVPWYWLLIAIVSDIVVYVTQGWRWSLLLTPVAPVPVGKSVQAVYIGLFANEVLPLRSGEIIRCYLQSKWAGIELPVVIASAVIERIFDGIILVVAFFAFSLILTLPGLIVQLSQFLVAVLLVLSVALGIVMYSKALAHHAVAKSRWAEKLWHVVEGLHLMGNAATFYKAFAVSVLYLILQIIPVYAVIKGYGIDFSYWMAAVVLIILRLGTTIPLTPGNVGSFHASATLALELFNVGRDNAVGIATLLFLVVTVPLWMAGFIALIATRMRLGDIHRHATATHGRHTS